jgi:hypothetical protein
LTLFSAKFWFSLSFTLMHVAIFICNFTRLLFLYSRNQRHFPIRAGYIAFKGNQNQ